MDEDCLLLDGLPYVCLWHVCSFLSPESLSRLSRVNKVLYDVSSSEELWRYSLTDWKNHSLNRWQFCNIKQVSEGPQKWQRYFRARRRVESRMDTGRPTKDYRVKSLRGHNADVVNAVCLDSSSGDLENPTPPLVISLSSDHVVYAWNVTEGKTVWSLENRLVSSIAGHNNMIAVGDNDGHATIYLASDWSEVAKFAPPTPHRIVTALEFASVAVNRKTINYLLICYCLDDSSGEISFVNLSDNQPVAVLATNTACAMLSIKGVWLAAAQEHSASEVYIWNLGDVLVQSPPSHTPHPPHVTLHVTNSCSRPLIWLRPGTLATFATGQPSLFVPPMPGPIPIPGVRPMPVPLPGQVHILPFPGHFQPTPNSDLEIWDVMKHLEDSKKSSSQVYHIKHMYDAKTVKLSCFPRTVAYSNGLLVVGEESGCVKVIDANDGKHLQEFSDHKAAVTDIYTDTYRVLTCSKDFSIRVYSWDKEGGTAKPTYKLCSRYQLLGGSVALKTHDGFNRVLCQSGSCVGVAGNVLKLYTFIHQLEEI